MPTGLFGDWLDRHGMDMTRAAAMGTNPEGQLAWNAMLFTTARGDESGARAALDQLNRLEALPDVVEGQLI